MGAGASAEALGEGDVRGPVAQEGYDSDLNAEASDDYARRPEPAFGEPQLSTEGGRLSKNPSGGAAAFPCHSSIHVPAGYDTPEGAEGEPSERLLLDYVHGYRAHDARSNLLFTAQGRAVYHAAAVGVVMDVSSREQKFFTGHTDDIICLDVSYDGATVATGQVGENPKVCLWDAATCELKHELTGQHQNAVLAVSFSADGRYLASVGKDARHTLVVWDLQAAAGAPAVLAKGECGEGRIYACDFDPKAAAGSPRVVTGGDRHLKFWTVENGFLVARAADFTSAGSAAGGGFGVSTFLSVAFTPDGCTLAGTKGGALYKFEEGGTRAVKKIDSVHQGSINALSFAGERIVTAGRDGKVRFFSPFLEPLSELNMAKVLEKVTDDQQAPLAYPEAPCVRAICYDAKQGKLLVGLKTSEVYLVDASGPDTWKAAGGVRSLTVGHAASFDKETGMAAGEVRGLACHPSEGHFATAGDDRSIRVWSCAGRNLSAIRVLHDAARCAGFHPKKRHLAVGCRGGDVLVLDLEAGRLLKTISGAAKEICQVKFSPCGRFLASASGDGAVRVYSVFKGQLEGYGLAGSTPAGGPAVTHLDWSEDSRLIQCNTHDMQLLFFTTPACEPAKAEAPEVKDAEWATWTCIAGWPVQGVWGAAAGGEDVNAAMRSNRGEWKEGEASLATADDFGRVRLFKYPCDVGRGKPKEYLGHAAHVTNVAFTYNDRYLVTTGGGDRCVFVWRHLEEGEEDEDEEQDAEDDRDYSGCKGNRPIEMVPAGMEGGRVVYEPVNACEGEPNPYKNHSLRELGAIRGYKSPMVGRPCMGQMHVPNEHKIPLGEEYYDKPAENLQLKWAYGYRGYDTRQNVFFSAKASEVVYHTAALGIALDTDSHSQRFITDDPQSEGEAEGNTDDVLCLARSTADHNIFASGEIGRQPKIVVWSAEDMKAKSVLHGFHTKAVVSLCFNPTGKYLASVGLDSNHSVALWDWEKEELLATYKADTNKVLCVNWSPYDGTVVTTGKKHVKFALNVNELTKGTRIKLKKGTLSGSDAKVQTFYAACFTRAGTTLVGTRGGDLYMFEGTTFKRKVDSAHKGRVGALHALGPAGGDASKEGAAARLVVSGGDDGVVRTWNPETLEPIATLGPIPGPHKGLKAGGISSVFCDSEEKFVVGTKLNEVLLLEKVGKAPVRRLVAGHAEGEVWGLAVNPKSAMSQAATCGDDGTVRLWDFHTHTLKESRQLVAPADAAPVAGTSFSTGCVRCAAFDPEGKMLAVGLFCGQVFILDAEDLSTFKEIDQKREGHSEWVSDIKWSPDGNWLATASHDNTAKIYNTQSFTLETTLKGHSSFLTSLNWSKDGYNIVTNSGDYEILYWKNVEGKWRREPSSSSCKDTVWDTQTGTLGWSVLGVWYKGSDGTDINTVDVIPGRQSCCATGDDRGMVSVLKYPAMGGPSKVYGGHSSHVTGVRFDGTGQRLFSTGGEDGTLCEWQVITTAA